jgi:hypothetical protein
VRPPGAENYPEPCPREKGTERRCGPERIATRILFKLLRAGFRDTSKVQANWLSHLSTREKKLARYVPFQNERSECTACR